MCALAATNSKHGEDNPSHHDNDNSTNNPLTSTGVNLMGRNKINNANISLDESSRSQQDQHSAKNNMSAADVSSVGGGGVDGTGAAGGTRTTSGTNNTPAGAVAAPITCL